MNMTGQKSNVAAPRLLFRNFLWLTFLLLFWTVAFADGYDTRKLDNEIASAFSGGLNPSRLDKIASKIRTDHQRRVDASGERTIWKSSYLDSLDMLLSSKIGFGKIAIRLSGVEWRNPDTIKLAIKFKGQMDRFSEMDQFDPDAKKRIHKAIIAKVATASKLEPDGDIYYLDVDKKSRSTKLHLLAFDKKMSSSKKWIIHGTVPLCVRFRSIGILVFRPGMRDRDIPGVYKRARKYRK
uniref:Uncharacterized protein n=1 Tax=Candidatus Kentrum sp. UNK TaxID=2126344 RepID=A0A451A418_9GAMM|nr:MAG: hypothetical protein BECKUNK1418G_GA0071005_101318 [Candidatus Kentron sp. UNK]VFK69463.1 MAG: hypothetical protein BECKUNK1418H_GA0071006_101418 [Candidatus Kentron sp. UNK]